MPKIRSGTSAQNYETKAPHKTKPLPELPKKPKAFDKKPHRASRRK